MSKPMKEMALVEHLGELRKRIIVVLVVFVAGLIGGIFVAEPIYHYLTAAEQAKNFELHAFSFWDGIGIYMKIAAIFSLVISIPLIFYQLWAFVKPGLHKDEQKAAVRYVPYAFILFIVGIVFGYYIVFPMTLSFTTMITKSMGLTETYGITNYLNFMFNLVLPLALLFELPLVVMFLTRIRILNPLRLRKMRKVAYFALVFIAVVITPPDFISDFLVTIPLLLLYEFSVFLSSTIYRKQLEADMERDSRYVSLDEDTD
ncbi:twin-arginine translocase subunit TatC [Paenibacillus ihbetae]|uniref:Sec-independent protein translocase protein TatC n=1 Tax=Paenibacillus ihbetae TaxID=1870820 RepID=A0A1B2E3N8_9BACL|nr:twin-arginine translocase subunit TatC [Paenibacillus ihbetae]ANY74573.1 twin arginine-targeting protein translocase TatC [Paenibacillus ihbetae]OOC63256.1 twin arginine-targeting protein translocase TatC [Paenibacillus ihbetae]